MKSSDYKGFVLNPANSVEYASNSSTSVTTDLSSANFSNDFNGSATPSGSASAAFLKRVRFKSAIQSDDVLILEVSTAGSPWVPVENAAYQTGLSAYSYQGSTTYGMGLVTTAAIGGTDVDVGFGRYFYTNNAAYGGAGADWSVLTSTRWRVRKTKALAPAGVKNLVGAKVGPWTTYTPTVTGMTDNTGTVSGKWRKVGDSMEIRIDFLKSGVAGSGSSPALFSIPAGFTIDSSVVGSVGSPVLGTAGTYSVETANQYAQSQVLMGSATHVGIANTGAGSGYFGSDFRAGAQANIQATIPIAEWAGDTNAVLAEATNVEYAFNTNIWDSSDTTSFGVGPNGAPISGALSSNRTKRVRFNSPIKSSETVVLEYRSTVSGQWVDAASSIYPYTNFPGVEFAGRLQAVSGSLTDVEVFFGQYAVPGTTYNSTTGAISWSASAYNAWRVRKYNPLTPVGIDIPTLATATKPGLIYRTPDTNLTVTGTGWTTVRARGYAYSLDGVSWKLNFNIEGSMSNTTRTGFAVSVSGIAFGPRYQAISAHCETNTGVWVSCNAFCTSGGGNFVEFRHTSAGTTFILASGDVELTSKPTWA